MASFKNLALTTAGEEYLQSIIMGEIRAPLTFTGIAIGDGKLASGETPAFRTSLVHEVHRLPIENFDKSVRGKLVMTARLATDILAADVLHRELGLYASNDNGDQILMTYGNAGDEYDYIPATGDKAAIYKTITVIFSTGGAEVTFADLPSDDLVSITALNARIAEVLPRLAWEAALDVCNDTLADAKKAAIDEINNASADVLNAAKTATEKATEAANSATDAANSATAADSSKKAAATSASNAKTSETNAANSAKAAADSKTACEGILAQMQGLLKNVPLLDGDNIFTGINQFPGINIKNSDNGSVYGLGFLGTTGSFGLILAPYQDFQNLGQSPLYYGANGAWKIYGGGGINLGGNLTVTHQATFNNGIINNSGIYYTPTGTPVQIGAVTTAADGVYHGWLVMNNGEVNGAQLSAKAMTTTGVSPDPVLAFTDRTAVLYEGGLDMRSHKILNVASGTAPTDAATVAQAGSGGSVPENVITTDNIAEHAVTGLFFTPGQSDYKRGDVALHLNIENVNGVESLCLSENEVGESIPLNRFGGVDLSNYQGPVNIKTPNGTNILRYDSNADKVVIGAETLTVELDAWNFESHADNGWSQSVGSQKTFELMASNGDFKVKNGKEILSVDSNGNISLGDMDANINMIGNNILTEAFMWRVNADSMVSLELCSDGDFKMTGNMIEATAWYSWVAQANSIYTMEINTRGEINFHSNSFAYNGMSVVTSGSVNTLEL